MGSRRSESTASAASAVEIRDLNQGRTSHGRHNHLRDAAATFDAVRLLTKVNQRNLDLTAIIRVDGTWRVEHRYPVLDGETRPRPHLRFRVRRQRHGDAGWDQCALAGLEHDRRLDGSQKVEPGGFFCLVGGQRQVGAMGQSLQLHRNGHRCSEDRVRILFVLSWRVAPQDATIGYLCRTGRKSISPRAGYALATLAAIAAISRSATASLP